MKQKKDLPFIEMPAYDYQKLIQANTQLFYRASIEPERHYENGEEVNQFNDTILEVRMSPSFVGTFYVYSSFTNKLWKIDKLEELSPVVSREQKCVNKECTEWNEHCRRESIEDFMKETDPLLKSVKDIIGDNSRN